MWGKEKNWIILGNNLEKISKNQTFTDKTRKIEMKSSDEHRYTPLSVNDKTKSENKYTPMPGQKKTFW